MADITRDEIKNIVMSSVEEAVDLVCSIIGVPAADPVEVKARELRGILYPGKHDAPFDALISDEQEKYYRLARHVLGES